MGGHRALGDYQPLGDLTIAQPERQQRGNLPLTRAQSGDLLCRALWWPVRSRHWSFRGGKRQVQRLLCSHVSPGFPGLCGRLRAECLPCRPFGIATWRTTGTVKDIQVRALTAEEKG